MNKILVALLLPVSCLVCADQPPDWSTFRVDSSNFRYFASVTVSDHNGSEHPWEWRYELSIWDANDFSRRPDKALVWSADYQHPGYSEGILSDDGRCFVYVDYWYRHEHPAVHTYCSGQYRAVPGKSLGMDEASLRSTVSHKLWLDGSAKFVYEAGRVVAVEIATVQGIRSVEL